MNSDFSDSSTNTNQNTKGKKGSSSMGDRASFRIPLGKQIKSSIFRLLKGSQKKNSEYDDLLEKSNIVGPIHRGREEKEIIEILLKETAGQDHVPPVVAITGIAGIGKTTLALLVCEDNKVKDRFGSPIWLNAAGKTFDELASIAGPVKAAATSSRNPSLLVLDDLRGEISVSELRKHDVSVGAGAIIVTTRRTWQSHGDEAIHVFPLAGLDVVQSRSLFTSLGSSNKHKEEITEILDKCNGFPLAIKLVSTFLESRAGTLQEAKLSELLRRLLMLEPHEVQLLAYVSLFPDDYLIHADRLIHLWIAEGFVPPEESWRRVIEDFVASGIFQDVKREEDGDGVVKSCRVHPYVQELARFVAKKDEFISTGIDVSQLLLRASFDLRSADSVSKLILFLKDKKKARDLRTILFHAMVEFPLVLGNQQEKRMNEYTCDKVLSTCKALRVLDLQHLGMNMVPSSIGKLKDLTYLDLSHNNIEKLPNSITKLSQLKTLKLSQCLLLKELPKDLKDLTKLTHLHIDGCVNIQSMPRGINNLTSLQTLSHFVVGKNEPMACEELKNLNQLRGHLEIMYPERLKFQGSSSEWMNQKEHLRRLTFRLDQHDKGNEQDQEKALQFLEPHTNLTELHVVGYKGDKFPSWIPSLGCLVKLSLYNCSTPEPLPRLDELPSLEVLELRRMHSLRFIAEKCDDSVHPFFPSLKKLTLWDCPKLESWWRNDNNPTDGESRNSIIFSCISSLKIQHCPNLTRMPLYPTLDEILMLENSSVEPMRDTIHYGESGTGSEEAKVVPFSKLKCMIIAKIQKFPPEEWLVKFTSFEELHIRDCFQLEALPSGFKHLRSLQSLTIETCPVLDLDQSPDEWEGLEKLNSLIIKKIPKLKSLPMGLEKVKSLREIGLHDCAGLTFLPKEIGDLTSLVRLEICQCENLVSLPKGIEKLKSLDTLIIRDCPLLMPRCQPNTGDDWPQIAHVKNILVKQTSQDFGLGKLRM